MHSVEIATKRRIRLDRIWYGGDYNPEQWPSEVWDADVRLMKHAGVTVATVGVFSWARIEPSDGVFEFGWLDDVLDRLHAGGIRVDLATATASPPPWLTLAHPDVLPVTEGGVQLSVGSRQQYSPSSRTYRRYAARLVRTIAERYRHHPALEAWHINNELACHIDADYSDESADAFRQWLERRYGSIEGLNHAWGTSFWSQAYQAFAEVMPPRSSPTFKNPTQLLDWRRFSSDAWLGVFRDEAAILRELAPQIPLTTNFMGFFKPVDYWAWADEVDFISDDHYVDPADPKSHITAAMTRDLMRSLRRGRPWILMEQATSAVQWRERNPILPAGWHRTLSLQAVARGADGVMQFQWRQSRAGAETFHSAMLPHSGTDTRVFRETVELGADLEGLADLVGSRQSSSVAIMMDWDSWWASEQPASPAQMQYVLNIRRWYEALWDRNVLVDFVSPKHDLTSYKVVVVPGLQVLSEPDARRLAEFVEAGGQLISGYLTAVFDEHLHVHLGGYLGGLRDVLGVDVEEFSPPAAASGTLRIEGLGGGLADEWAEIVRLRGATTMSTFVGGPADAQPAVTRNPFGSGAGWYVATMPHDLASIVARVLADARLEGGVETPPGVECIERGGRRFLLNHTDEAVVVCDETILPRHTVVVAARPSESAPVRPQDTVVDH